MKFSHYIYISAVFDPSLSPVIAGRNESRTVIRIKVLHILSFVLSTNRQLYEVSACTHKTLECEVN